MANQTGYIGSLAEQALGDLTTVAHATIIQFHVETIVSRASITREISLPIPIGICINFPSEMNVWRTGRSCVGFLRFRTLEENVDLTSSTRNHSQSVFKLYKVDAVVDGATLDIRLFLGNEIEPNGVVIIHTQSLSIHGRCHQVLALVSRGIGIMVRLQLDIFENDEIGQCQTSGTESNRVSNIVSIDISTRCVSTAPRSMAGASASAA